MSQKKDWWTSHLSTAHQRELVLTFIWPVIGCWLHTAALLSVCRTGGGWLVLVLNHPWNVSEDETRIIQTLSFSCYQEERKATKDEFSSSSHTKAALSDVPAEDMMSKGTWCPWLSFALSSSFSDWHSPLLCVWKAAIQWQKGHIVANRASCGSLNTYCGFIFWICL